MTLFALGVAVDLPEPDLQALLNRLVLSGHVRCVGDVEVAPAGGGRALYRLARRPVLYIPAQRRAV
ncbi:MAG TPA: hypothetical protein VI248_14690 [Kineosporiaceae bacterium]